MLIKRGQKERRLIYKEAEINNYKFIKQLIAVCPPRTTPQPIACFLKFLA